MLGWMQKSSAAQGPLVVTPTGSTTAADRKSPAIATSHDTLIRRTVVGTLAAVVALSAGHRDACTECVRLIQSCLDCTSNEVADAIAAFKSDGASVRSVESLYAYVVQLHFAERLTEALNDSSERVACEQANWSLLLDAWSAAAEGALRVVTHLKGELGIQAERRWFYTVVHLIAIGMHPQPPPSVNHPERVPRNLERRDSQRSLVGSWIQIAAPAGVTAAFLNDISPTGFGFATPAAIAPGEMIEAAFGDHRILAARVIWVRGTRAGASFLMPLRPGDPLLPAVAEPPRRCPRIGPLASLVKPEG